MYQNKQKIECIYKACMYGYYNMSQFMSQIIWVKRNSDISARYFVLV